MYVNMICVCTVGRGGYEEIEDGERAVDCTTAAKSRSVYWSVIFVVLLSILFYLIYMYIILCWSGQ